MKVFFIVGPTASGKSYHALELAKKLNSAILNCDSLQVYQGLDIGTAKPSLEERQTVPHYLFDIIEKGKVITAADFRRLVLEKLNELEKSGYENVIIVGGSGFYVKALIEGMYSLPTIGVEEKKSLARRLEDMIAKDGEAVAHAELIKLDPGYAKRISENDLYRIGRGLEIIWSTGKTVSAWQEEHELEKQKGDVFPFEFKIAGLEVNRDELRIRVQKRTDQMLDAGFVEEVEGLLAEGLKAWTPLNSVGYKEIIQYLNNEISFEELPDKITTSTMQLAKKQMTWFRGQFAAKPEFQWFKYNSETVKLLSWFC